MTRLLAWIGCVLLLGGCASGLHGNGPLTRRAIERRLALGAWGSEVVAARGDEAELVELARDLGLRDEAVQSAGRHLYRARAAVTVAELAGDRDALRRTRRELDDAAKLAMSTGRWADDPDLVLEAALLSARPDAHRRALRWALRRQPSVLPAVDLAPAHAAARGDPRSALGLYLAAADDDAEPDEAMLDGLGREASWLRSGAFMRAIRRGDLVGADRHARAIAKLDPGDFDARIYLLARAEVKQKQIPDTAALFVDDIDTPGVGASARARLRAEAYPRSEALALARAATLFDLGLTGDAAQILHEASVVATPEGREIARALWARIRILAGEPEPYRAWVKSLRGKHSVAADTEVAYLDDENRNAAVREAARDARRRLADDDVDLPLAVYVAAVLDRKSPLHTRTRAERKLRQKAPQIAAFVLACRDAERDRDVCRDLTRFTYQPDALVELLERYRDSPHVDERWLASVAAHPDTLRRLGPTIAALDRTRIALAPRYVELALRSEIAQGRPDAAQQRLDRFGALLDDETFTFIALAIADARAHPSDRDAALQRYANLPALDPLYVPATDASGGAAVVERLRELSGRSGLLVELERGGTYYSAGALAKAATTWAELAKRSNGRAAAVIRSRAAFAAWAAGDAELHASMLRELDPNSAAHHHLAALGLASAKEHREAARHSAAALIASPDPVLYRELFRHELAAGTDTGRTLASARAWVPGSWDDELVSAHRALVAGKLPDADTFVRRASWGWSGDAAWALGRAGADDEQIVEHAIEYAVDRIAAQGSEARAAQFARKLVAYLDGVPQALDYRTLQLDMLFLLDRADDGLAVARRRDRQGRYASVPPDNFRVLLLEARKRGQVDDHAAWKLWRWVELGESSPEVDAIFSAPPPSGPLLEFVCQQLVADDRLDEALPVCERAFATDDTWGSAVSLSYALLEREAIDHARLTKVFHGKRKPPPFDPAGPALAPDTNDAYWYQNRAVWLAARDEMEASADAWLQAYALGISAFEPAAPDDMQLLFRGEVVRHREVNEGSSDDATVGARLGYQALVSGAWVGAKIYARKVLSSTKDEPDTRAARTFADQVLDVAQLAESDVANMHIEGERLALAIAEVFDEGRVEERAKLQQAHPDSAVASLSLLQEYARKDDMKRAAPLADRLLAAHPDVPLVVTSALPVLLANGQHDRARQLFADLAAEHRSRPSVRWAALPESVTGPHPGVPAWVRDPSRFDAKLAAITDDELADLVPRWRSHTEIAADAFFPIGHEPREGERLGATDREGGWTRIAVSARASRCEAEACAEPLLDALRGEGLSVLWSRQKQLPAGIATDAMVSDGIRLWSIAVLPAGGRVFEISASAPMDHFAEFLPTVALLREGFAPLDRVLPAYRAASLRATGVKVDPTVRLAARRELGRDPGSTSCPATELLESLPHASTRAEVLLDLLLIAPTAADRRRVLACAKPTSADARRIALVALLDEDAAVHEYGRTAVLFHGNAVLRDVRQVLSGPLEPALSAADLFTREDLPSRGLVEVALALPPARGKELVQSLLASQDERDRTMAWVAASLREGLVDPATVDTAIRSGKPLEALLAVEVSDARGSQHIAALRSRLDALTTIATKDTMWLALSIAGSVASEVAREDGKRLRRLGKLVATSLPRAKIIRKSFDDLADEHARALALAADESKATADDSGALELLHARRNRAESRPQRDMAVLRRTALPDLLPGDDWVYARVASPGLFASTVDDLSHRLDPPDPTQRLLVDPIVESIKASSGFASLLEGGGLDLGKPIECATPAGTEAFVCSATVADRDALLTVLGQRPYGSDAGVSIPMHLSTTAGLVPLLLSALPAFVHGFVYEDADEEDAAPDPVLASERLRTKLRLGNTDVEYYAIVHQYADRLSVDSERYLFLGDRLFVFSSAALAWRVLLEPPPDSRALAEHPEFGRLTGGWKDGAALQAVAMGVASPLPKADVAIEVVVDGSGLSFRYAATTDADVHDVRRVEALLPQGAVTRIAAGVGDLDALDELDFSHHELLPTDVLPPLSVLRRADAIAFGWYPAVGDSVWKRWVTVLQRSPAVDKAAQRAGLRGLSATPMQSKSGIHFAARDGLVVLASDASLLGDALRNAIAEEGERADVLLARGAFAGAAASNVVAELPHTADIEPGTLRFGAAMVGIVDDVSYAASWNPASRVGVLEGRLKLRLVQGGDRTEVVDQWLAAARMRNAGRLPRSIGDSEAEGTLVFTFEVADAKAFARQTVLPSPRAKVDVVDDTHARLTVHATPSKDPQPLTTSKRKKLLDSTDALRSDDAKIVKLSRTLAPTGTAPDVAAKKILEWVHGRIAYEVTPRSLDSVAILEAGRGDCSEYARLTVSLLRAAGVPAEVRDGMAAQGDEMVAHAWVGYHDGERWHEIDPTWGRMNVTAGHLPVSVVDILALISLDRLEVTEIEAQP